MRVEGKRPTFGFTGVSSGSSSTLFAGGTSAFTASGRGEGVFASVGSSSVRPVSRVPAGIGSAGVGVGGVGVEIGVAALFSFRFDTGARLRELGAASCNSAPTNMDMTLLRDCSRFSRSLASTSFWARLTERSCWSSVMLAERETECPWFAERSWLRPAAGTSRQAGCQGDSAHTYTHTQHTVT